MSAATDDPGLRFMQEHYPWRLKARETPHDFKPLGEECEGGCKAGCICDDCWQRKSTRIHTKIAKREAEAREDQDQ